MPIGKIEIDDKIIGSNLPWNYSGPVRNMKDGIPLQRKGGEIVVSSMPLIPLTCDKLKNIKFYYGDSGMYLRPSATGLNGKPSHIIYRGQGVFIVNGSMEEEQEND